MTDNNIDYHSLTNQKILGDFVARAVILNASMLVEDLFNADLLSLDEIENYYIYECPKCGGVMDEELTEGNGEGWYCSDCDYEQVEEPD